MMQAVYNLALVIILNVSMVQASECVDQLATIFKYMRSDVPVPATNITYKELAGHMGLTSMNFITDIG